MSYFGRDIAGAWSVISDATAADGGAVKLTQAVASPTNYFEVMFFAEGGIPYRLWIRGRAQSNYWGNDSVFVQFTASVDGAGTERYRVGTASALGECPSNHERASFQLASYQFKERLLS
jgi:hypothetical protein